jgi:integrase
VQARKTVGEDQLPVIRLHDLRHTHATLLLAADEPVKVVSERLDHANATIALAVYQLYACSNRNLDLALAPTVPTQGC